MIHSKGWGQIVTSLIQIHNESCLYRLNLN